MARYTEDKKNIVTLHNRKKLRPAIDETNRPANSTVPDVLYFVLPDGVELPVNSRQEIIIGRQPREDDPPVTVDLEDFEGHSLGVSRHHCMIKFFNDKLMLVDLDSINGTFVNGLRAMPLKRYGLSDGDIITVGRLTLELRYEKRNRH